MVFGAWGWRCAESPLWLVDQSCARVCEGACGPVCACPRECVCAREHCSTWLTAPAEGCPVTGGGEGDASRRGPGNPQTLTPPASLGRGEPSAG